MARSRIELSEILHRICGNVYFQPPTNTKLSYPCIVYKLERMDVRFADNGPYRICDEYSITYITRDPDDINIRTILMLPYCRFDRAFSSDNLHHNAYTLYF